MPSNIRELWGRISTIFEPGGSLSQALSTFESRPGQKEMSHMVFQAMMQECFCMVEAGTGTGKTLAYLIPGVFISMALDEPVVIATKTINLQEQILKSDLPLLKKATGENFSAVLVKGWSNYLCLRRFKKLELSQELFDSRQLKSIQNLADWNRTTITGDRSDADFFIDESVWDKIRAEPTACNYNRCPHYDDCYFFIQRRKIQKANLLITNHAFLFAQVAQRRNNPGAEGWSVLPRFSRLVLDEAHHVEDVATSFLGDDASSGEFHRILQSLMRHPAPGQEAGLLPRVRNAPFSPGIESRIRTLLDGGLIPAIRPLQESFNSFLYGVAQLPSLVEDRDRVLFTPSLRREFMDTAREEMENFTGKLNSFKAQLEHLHSEGVREDPDLGVEISSTAGRIEAFRDSLLRVIHGDDEKMIYSLEYNRTKPPVSARFRSYPLSVGEILYEELFSRIKSVTFTSATLAVNRSFSYLKGRLGLKSMDRDVIISGVIDSPFDFRRQALLAVPGDMPEINSDSFLPMGVPHLCRLIREMEGRTFLLFTSYRMLDQCAGMLRERLEEEGFNLMIQGEYPRHVLLEQFKEREKSVLLGTDSFWEGVDVPGRNLECVVLMKLPFKVPSDPVIRARVELMEKQGQNPFLSYQVPQAVIQFKQGFGRLIRNRADRGVIVVMDNRIITRNYGRTFIRSLPPCTVLKGSFAGIVSAVEKWRKKYQGEMTGSGPDGLPPSSP